MISHFVLQILEITELQNTQFDFNSFHHIRENALVFRSASCSPRQSLSSGCDSDHRRDYSGPLDQS